MTSGIMWALFGAALSVFLAGIGSSVGTALAGMSAAGLTSKEPEKFVATLVLQALPGTQGIYGLIGAIMVMSKLKWFSVATAISNIDPYTGWLIFAACLPVGIAGMLSGIYQGKVCAAAVNIIAKAGTKKLVIGLVYAAIVETYAIIGLVATLLLLGGIKV